MSWFNKARKPKIQIAATRAHHVRERVEVVVHKEATQEAIAKAQEANKHLNELLVTNRFTIKIYLAAGGHLPKQEKGIK